MKKILIVSSSPAFIERNTHLLTRPDVLILSATSGHEALLLHERDTYDLIISEFMLEDMWGDQLCQLVRQESVTLGIPFVLVYRHTIAEERERALQSNADAKIPKPIQPEQFLITIGELIHNSQMVRSPRVTINVTVLANKHTNTFNCVSHNISIEGMLLETDHYLARLDQIICEFSLPDSSQIRVDGEIMRSVIKMTGGYQYGIRFINLSSEARHDIASYVETVSLKK
jgi:CheY-like chemotaxis protein